MEKITSLQNTRIKNLVKLQKASERREQKLFLVEGLKEIQLAIDAGYEVVQLYFCPGKGLDEKSLQGIIKNKKVDLFEISGEVFNKIAYREGSDGLMAVLKLKTITLDDIKLSTNPLLIIAESVEKPGNLGAILRTADAVSADAVIICDPRTDLFNPNVIRSSIGCLFTNQVVASSNELVFKWLKKNKIKSYAAALAEGAKPYHNFDYAGASAFIMGTEADGLTGFWLANADEKIIIPMTGKIDSLNVSVSTAIIIYEAARQRGFKANI